MIEEKLIQYIENTIKENWDINAWGKIYQYRNRNCSITYYRQIT